MAEETWTPYALEPIRIRHIRRRLLLTILAILALLLLAYLAYLGSTSTQKNLQVCQQGGTGCTSGGGGGVSLQAPDAAKPKDHVTVGLTPGAVTRVDTGSDPAAAGTAHTLLPTFDRGTPYDWTAYLVAYGPYLLVLLAAWFLTKKRGKYDEINFGIYKGAMPLEMITASHGKTVFTRKFARSSVFGKGRSDHLPTEVIRVHPRED